MPNKNFIYLVIFSLMFVLLLSCAGTKKEKVPEQLPPSSRIDESFDPLSLNDEDLKFEDKNEPAREPVQSVKLPVQEEMPELENNLVNGFRIQILSTKDIEGATKAKNIAMEQFEDLDEQFYLDFDSPYYKIRLGDFKTREEAEKVREVVRARGYPKAWVVPSKVWSNPGTGTPADSTELEIEIPQN